MIMWLVFVSDRVSITHSLLSRNLQKPSQAASYQDIQSDMGRPQYDESEGGSGGYRDDNDDEEYNMNMGSGDGSGYGKQHWHRTSHSNISN